MKFFKQMPVPLLVYMLGSVAIACVASAGLMFTDVDSGNLSVYAGVAQLVWALGNLAAAVRYDCARRKRRIHG